MGKGTPAAQKPKHPSGQETRIPGTSFAGGDPPAGDTLHRPPGFVRFRTASVSDKASLLGKGGKRTSVINDAIAVDEPGLIFFKTTSYITLRMSGPMSLHDGIADAAL
ncbi:MAG: hypothetical protein U5R06_24490 [candidate division KSB1 bacterium]|nr:hypothetical protein [candidate division KSB1 bacterium]